jgi:predicted nucleic acid-binding protein
MGQIVRGAGVYLDANILIRLTEGLLDDRKVIDAVVADHVNSGAVFITSELAVMEVLVHPIRHNNQRLVEEYGRLMTNFVRPYPVSLEVLRLAAELRAHTPSQRTPDAIHVATALLQNAQVFVTGDRGIKNLPAGIELLVI